MIPVNIKKYFWDVKIDELDLQKYKEYIIERILEMGDEEAVLWLKKIFSERDILMFLKESRRISPASLNYWNLVLNKKIV